MTTENVSHNPLDRREFIKRTSAAAVAGLSAPYVWGQKTDETLVVNSFGGEYQELFEKNIIEPFEKKFGVKVVHDPTGTSSQDYAKIRASKGAPGFDVAAALSPPEVLLGAKEGLLEKITDKEVPNLKYTWEKARQTLPPVTVIHTLSSTRSSTTRTSSTSRCPGPTTGNRTSGTERR
jgi:putative spermidine/putrescine transport system substrate-binding protein